MATVPLYSAVYPSQGLRRPYYAGHKSSYLDLIPEDDTAELTGLTKMEDADPDGVKVKSKSTPAVDQLATEREESLKPPLSNRNPQPDTDSFEESDYLSAGGTSANGLTTPSTPGTATGNK